MTERNNTKDKTPKQSMIHSIPYQVMPTPFGKLAPQHHVLGETINSTLVLPKALAVSAHPVDCVIKHEVQR